ncbi:MAG: (5-formylfuran-3-yl)methyl phosphate synthase [Ardenticatenia bacterium]|nr:(5-formylfuran-3-yl)methyl phosphate synthase [Ardenticatenia bacterium]
MQLLISVTDAEEAQAALQGGADIIDVKNPAEGALGAAQVTALHDVCALLPPKCPSSAALGDSTSSAGALALAAYGAAALGVSFVKVGLRTANPDEAVALLRAVRAGAHLANASCIVVAVGYADATRVGALPWTLLPKIARAARSGGCMIDTALKDGHTLFDYCDEPALQRWLDACREAGLLCALAGSLGPDDLPALRRLHPDVVGFRGAACRGSREGGRVDAALVAALRLGLRG